MTSLHRPFARTWVHISFSVTNSPLIRRFWVTENRKYGIVTPWWGALRRLFTTSLTANELVL